MRIMIAAADITYFDENNAAFESAYGLLSVQRRAKADRIKSDADKKRCVASGIILNYLLKKWSDLQESVEKFDYKSDEIAFEYQNAEGKSTDIDIDIVALENAIADYKTCYNYETVTIGNGKPVFKDYPDIHFNISHSGKYVVCVVASVDVGIDIDGSRNVNMSVANRFFSSEESEWVLKESTEAEACEACKMRFFRLWTLKEAFAKVTGEGIAASIGRAYFKVTKDGKLEFESQALANEYALAEYQLEDYCVALIYRFKYVNY